MMVGEFARLPADTLDAPADSVALGRRCRLWYCRASDRDGWWPTRVRLRGPRWVVWRWGGCHQYPVRVGIITVSVSRGRIRPTGSTGGIRVSWWAS